MVAQKAISKMQTHTQYVQSAKITFRNGVALVKSASSSQRYTVTYLADLQITTSCECRDHEIRHRVCKHMEAVEHRLQTRKSAPVLPVLAEGVKVRLVKGSLRVEKVVCKDKTFVEPATAPVESDEEALIRVYEQEDEQERDEVLNEASWDDELHEEGLSDEEDEAYQEYLRSEQLPHGGLEERIERATLSSNRAFNLMR